MLGDSSNIRPFACSTDKCMDQSHLLLRTPRSTSTCQSHDNTSSCRMARLVRFYRESLLTVFVLIRNCKNNNNVCLFPFVSPRARDVPEKANGIEIYSALDYIRMRSHWNGCGLILHELCHHIHQQTFGLDCETIKQEYTRALQSGRYDRVLRRDSASNRDGAFDLAYAMIDHKEFFAEMSVTHWSHYYAHLDNASCTQLQSCSPPTIKELTPCSFSKNPISWFRSSFTPRRNPCSHCNKFYPFTQGQLRHYDPCLAKAMEAFWLKIAEWDDPCDNNTQCDGCWAHPRGSKHIAAVDVLEDVTWPDGINDTVNL